MANVPQYSSVTNLHVQKYYQPWLLSVSTTENVANGDQDRLATSRGRPIDTTLTALAQLVVFKLNVDSCSVALLDHDTRYTLAEACRDTILGKSRDNAELLRRDQLPSKGNIDGNVYGSTYSVDPNHSSDRARTVEALVLVEDKPQDATTGNLELPEKCKFYAGVPIYSDAHVKIGVLSVKAASPLDPANIAPALRCMQEVSQIVTDHLIKTKDAVHRKRGERIVADISSFVEELSSVKYKLDKPGEDARKTPSRENKSDVPRATDPQSNEDLKGSDGSVAHDSHKAGHRHLSSNNDAFKTKHMTEPKFKFETDPTSEPKGNPSDNDMWQIFTRAANVFRSGLDAQGCAFFDVDTSLFAGCEANGADLSPYDDPDPESHNAESDQHDTGQEELPVGHVDITSAHATKSAPQIDDNEPARLLGVSTDTQSEAPESLLRHNELKRFLLHFPCGAVFRFHDGRVVSADQSNCTQRITGGGPQARRMRKPQLVQHLSEEDERILESLSFRIKNINWLVFLPLFNYAKKRWFAGTLIWSTRTTPAASPEDEMLYLKTFGSCIMTEVTGMEALTTNRSKSNFIASISHELRSPLHGILGSLEFLEDSVSSAYQMSLVSSIQTCGRTLLDTIDHLLDYAKINNLNRTVAKRTGNRGTVSPESNDEFENEHLTLQTVEFDLALLLEEVVEAVFAGQTFRKTRVRGADAVKEIADDIENSRFDDSKSTEDQIHEGSAKFSGRVFIIVDVSPARSWVMKGQPGALRRIIMNVFGNAIKYCSKGTIEVSLRLDHRDEEKDIDIVEIIIRDTGRGMSKEFLQKDLFKPFAQEDSFVPGAGLGLSITKQIVDHIGGKIVVRSEKDVGTQVAVYLPLELNQNPGGPSDEVMQMASEAANGKTICLLNPTDLEQRPGKEQLSPLSMSFARMCRDWFGLRFIESDTIAVQADVFIYAEPPPIEYLLKHHSERRNANLGEKEAILLIICTNAFEAASLRAAGIAHLSSLGRVIEVVNQPVGIRKFAKVLLQSLQLVEAAQKKENLPEHEQAPKPDDNQEDERSMLRAINGARSLEYRPRSHQDIARSTTYDGSDEDKTRPAMSKFEWKSDQDLPWLSSTSNEAGLGNTESTLDRQPPDLSTTALSSSSLPPPTQSTNDASTPKEELAKNLPNILVVDDNAINLKLLVTFMKKLKLPYVEATNGLEALEKFKEAKEPFKFVLMDLQMPIMDGLESTRKIRTHEQDGDSKNPSMIIAITGVGSEEIKKEAMDSGISRFLTKPISFKVLKEILEKHDDT